MKNAKVGDIIELFIVVKEDPTLKDLLQLGKVVRGWAIPPNELLAVIELEDFEGEVATMYLTDFVSPSGKLIEHEVDRYKEYQVVSINKRS